MVADPEVARILSEFEETSAVPESAGHTMINNSVFNQYSI